VFEGFERPEVQIDMLRDYIRAVHVKNATPQPVTAPAITIPAQLVRLDQGLLDWAAIIVELETQGYSGYLTLEDLGKVFNTVPEMLAWDLEYLRGLVT
jgi:sugar phosphate isomerase/epimerase